MSNVVKRLTASTIMSIPHMTATIFVKHGRFISNFIYIYKKMKL